MILLSQLASRTDNDDQNVILGRIPDIDIVSLGGVMELDLNTGFAFQTIVAWPVASVVPKAELQRNSPKSPR